MLGDMITNTLAKQYISVRLPTPVGEEFTYAVPEGMSVRLGSYVSVPFGNRIIGAVVWDVGTTPMVAVDKIKPVTKLHTDIPPMPEILRRFVTWVAEYTLTPPGNVLKMTISVPKLFEETITQTEKYYTLAEIGSVRKTAQRQKVIDFLQDKQDVAETILLAETSVSRSVLQAMCQAGMLRCREIEVLRSPVPVDIKNMPQSIPLSEAQQAAANYLIEKIEEQNYSATLLDGVTGSGKTEVYFAVIRHILETSQGQILILLPEIVLTNQLLARFEERFGFQPVAWHSGLTPKQRLNAWYSIAKGEARLVIGARSALFLPFLGLSFIVVDEEHDPSYKQEEGVIYNARDMAVVRASLEKIPIVLASATPSLETVYNVETGKFGVIHLPSRYGKAVMPDINVIDMRQHPVDYGTWISAPLRQQLAETLQAGKQSMLYLNRRGYAPLTLCRKCGYRFQCPHCASWLVEHKKQHKLQCHHCGYHTPPPSGCPECKETGSMVACGPGVERIAEEVADFLPQANVAVLASDLVFSPKDIQETIQAILSGEVDIIIGTQMVAKGHHFPHLTLVGVVDADLGLEGGDLRAVERTYQLLHQVSGRAGRENDKGCVYIQSYHTENTILQALAKSDRDGFVYQEMQSRKRNHMPPFSRLAGVVLSGKKEERVVAAAKELARIAPIQEGFDVMGPAPAPLAYLRGNYRYRLLIKAKRTILLQKALKFWLMSAKTPSDVRIKVDIDPYNFF